VLTVASMLRGHANRDAVRSWLFYDAGRKR
jgi:hypothetical protein